MQDNQDNKKITYDDCIKNNSHQETIRHQENMMSISSKLAGYIKIMNFLGSLVKIKEITLKQANKTLVKCAEDLDIKVPILLKNQ